MRVAFHGYVIAIMYVYLVYKNMSVDRIRKSYKISRDSSETMMAIVEIILSKLWIV